MQAFVLLAVLASALGVSSHAVPRDAAATAPSPADQLARFDSFPDASCSLSSRRGTARVLRGEKDACRSLSPELGLGAKAIRISPTADEAEAADRAWIIDVHTYPFCMGDPVAVPADGVCLPAPAPGMHWMSYRLRMR